MQILHASACCRWLDIIPRHIRTRLQVLAAASTMSAVKPHVPLRAVMAGRTTTAELHAFVRMLLVDALRGAVRNDNGVTDIDEVRDFTLT